MVGVRVMAFKLSHRGSIFIILLDLHGTTTNSDYQWRQPDTFDHTAFQCAHGVSCRNL